RATPMRPCMTRRALGGRSRCQLVRILHRNIRNFEEVDYALRGTFPYAFQYRVGERQWAMERLADRYPRGVSKLDAARQSLHVLLRRGERLRRRYVRGRGRSLCGG